VIVGLLSPTAVASIFGDTWDAAATLIALFVLSESLDGTGFFGWAALRLARVAGGAVWRLYALTLLLTAGVTALLANDGAILMLTPIFAALLARIYPDERQRLPFLIAAAFFADAMSGILVPSNLTNIILADANHLSFARVAAWMALPTLAAFVAAGACFGLRFRARLGKPYQVELLEEPTTAVRDAFAFRAGWVALGVLVAGYLIGGELRLPVSAIAVPVALGMLALVHLRKLRPAREVIFAAPWSILVYALGMFAVITAAFDAHALVWLADPLRASVERSAGPRGTLTAGGLLALIAAAANNLPAALLGVLALAKTASVAPMAIYAIQLGVDIGPKLTPFGSLATLLWLNILRRNGISISWGMYIRENWWVTILTLLAAFAGLLASNTRLGG
jgi:arsenical pump membrane protein